MVKAYWMSPSVNGRNFEIAKMFVYVSMGFFLGDLIATFPFDLSLLTGKRHWRWPQLAYFGAKLTWITYMLTNFLVLWTVGKIDCQLLMNFTELQMGLVVCFSSFLLACRTVCVYEGTARKCIGAFLFVFGLGLVAAWMQGVPDVTSTWSSTVANSWNNGACTYDSVKSTYWAKYVVTIAFDLIVLVLTTVGIVRLNASTRIGDVLIKHGLIYFILTCAANTVVTVLTSLQLSPVMSLFMAVPQSTVCVISSTRLYMILAKQARPYNSTQINSGSLLHEAPFSSSKFSSMIRRVTGKTTFSISPTKSNFSTNLIVSQPSSSCEDLEKNSSNNVNKSTTMIRVDKRRSVQVDSISSPIPVEHPFTGQMPPVHECENEEMVNDSQFAMHYPRLLSRN